MHKMTTPAERLESLKISLRGLVFTQVSRIVARTEDMLCFQPKGDSTQYDDEPFFGKNWFDLTPKQRDDAEKSYRFYYGFTTEGIHFSSKSFSEEASSGILGGLSHVGYRINPPKKETWVCGTLYKQNAIGKGPAFCFWNVRPVQCKIFADLMLGRTRIEQQDAGQLIIGEGIESNHSLLHLVLALYFRDLGYFLFSRRNGETEAMDSAVKNIADTYDPSLWMQYVAKAEGQRVYSSLIPKPAPKPIVHVRDASYGQQVGLSTPFVDLSLSQG